MKPALCALLLTGTVALAACEATEPRTRIVLDTDSITFAGPTCFTEVSLTGVTREEFRGWSIEGTDVVGGITVEGRTGTRGWMYQGVVGRAPGTARLVATDADGGRAVVHIRVLDGKTGVAFLNDTTRLAVGDSAFLLVRPSAPCGVTMNPFAEPTIVGDTSRVNTYASDPAVLGMRSRVNSPNRTIFGLNAGTVRVVTKFWGAQDTAVVIVQ